MVTRLPRGAGDGVAARRAVSRESAGSDDRHVRWMAQLQAMIDDVASTAGPAMRELAAKAAELAAKAGDAAGPFAHRAASVTSDVGQRVAARGREIATDLLTCGGRAAETDSRGRGRCRRRHAGSHRSAPHASRPPRLTSPTTWPGRRADGDVARTPGISPCRAGPIAG